MNRNQRRLGRAPKNGSDCCLRKAKHENVEEVLPAKAHWEAKERMMNRCCFFSPDQKEVGQLTDELDTDHPNQNPLASQLQELRGVLCGSSQKVENWSQCANPVFIKTSDGAQWLSVDNADDIDKLLNAKDEETVTNCPRYKNIHISEVPRVKIIAEKFTKYKQNNVELRKLDEKVVCVEYDVLDHTDRSVQVMRAFFAIRPLYHDDADTLTELPSTIKNKFNIASEDLHKLSEKEVEIIDDKIADNRPYLDDLRKILRRKQSKKNKTSLDLQTLYEMANMEYLAFERDTSNLISKEGLQEVKDLILTKCKSSVHGISRRTVKGNTGENTIVMGAPISQSLVAELLRDEFTIKR